MFHEWVSLSFLEKVYEQAGSTNIDVVGSIFQLISFLIFIGIPITIIWFIVWMVKKVNRIEMHLETIAKNMEKEAKKG